MEFLNKLADIVENLNEKSSIERNDKVLRTMSFSGKELAFSQFERSQSKSKRTSISMRHGFQPTFMTISLPDHNDLPLLKMSMIRKKGIYNNKKQHLTAADKEVMEKEKEVGIISFFKQEDLFSDREFEYEKLPENLKDSLRRRLLVSQKIPADSAFLFSKEFVFLLDKFIKCP